MPFQDNPTMRPLYDTLEGGGPQAWKCLLTIGKRGDDQAGYGGKCNRITSTLAGMISHQKQVHNFEPQMEIKK